MADTRERDQPGTGPRSRRDGGGRGTSTGSPGGLDAGEDALAWSVTAMSGALRRIGDASGADVPQAVAAATEAVWWVTVVDAAITRHCPAAYRGALAALDSATAPIPVTSSHSLLAPLLRLGPGGPSPRPLRSVARCETPAPTANTGQLAGRPLAEALALTVGFLSRIHATAAAGNRRRSTAGQVPSAHIETSRRAMSAFGQTAAERSTSRT